MNKNIFFRKFVSVASVGLLIPLMFPSASLALVGSHSYTHPTNGDVFLGGDYIEIGISKYGSFGTTSGPSLPTGFYGTAERNNIGMSTNPTGFGETPDARMDFFLPGTPEERWAVGYKIAGTPTTGSNAFLRSVMNISNYTVTNQSSGSVLKATGTGSLNSKVEITQVISFNQADKFFKNVVTLKNIDTAPLDSVRYMRSFDPDNTRDKGGLFGTQNQILYTHLAGDGKAVVVADTSNNGSDPVFAVNASRSPILFYTSDSRARVSTFGFANADPYAAAAYDSPTPKGTSNNADAAITITFDVGTLAAGASESFNYYTSLDNRDFTEVLADIVTDDGDNVTPTLENAAPNSGDGNGDGQQDSVQANVTSIPNTSVSGTPYQTLTTTGCNTITSIGVNTSSHYGTDSYTYPLGLTNFTIACTSPGDTTTIRLYFDKVYDTANWKARKYINDGFTDIPGATFSTATVGAGAVTTMTYSITDGGPLDTDATANGIIVDPAGPAVLATTTTSTAAGVKAPNTGYQKQSMLQYYLVGIMGSFMITGLRLIPRKAEKSNLP